MNYLLVKAKREGDQKEFQKLYASAKRRKHVDFARVNEAVTAEAEQGSVLS